MNNQIIYLNFGLDEENKHSGLVLKENNTPILRCRVMKDGEAISLDEVVKAKLYYTTREDNKHIISSRIEGNEIIFEDFYKCLINPFCMEIQLVLFDADNHSVATNILIINVINSLNDDYMKLRNIMS